jgi:shikimate dehydrogenase
MIDSSTKLFGVFGKPIKHSKSPVIHNACFKQHNVNAVYLAFEIDNICESVTAIRTLNIQGASVTIPFKESIMDVLDWIDDDAKKIGAVNTVVNKDGKLHGFNTDYKAAIDPIKPFGIKGKKVCIIGAGGAAQAVAFGIHKEKGELTIINRNKLRGQNLALKYKANFISMDDIEKIKDTNPDFIINTTSIGMSPDIDEISFPSELLNPEMLVMDIVYNPLETKLLAHAKKAGCTTIDGLSMFLHQGAAQFNLWTNITPDIKIMRKTIMNGDN